MPGAEKMKIKVCLVGEGAVGKTALIRRFIHDEFDDRYISTLGAKVSKREMTLRTRGAPLDVDMMIWDIMGEKGFRELLKEAYFHGAQGILAVSDITRKDTMTDLHDWIKAVNKVTGTIPIHFLANKYDLKDHMDFTEQEFAAMAAIYKSPYTFTSAKTGENVEKSFQTIAELVAGRMVAR